MAKLKGTPADRRRFIIETVNSRGEVTDKEIEKESERRDLFGKAFSTSKQILKDDAAFFNQYGLDILRPPNEGRFIQGFQNTLRTYEYRKGIATKSKIKIGQFTASLLLGLVDRGAAVPYNRHDILTMLNVDSPEGSKHIVQRVSDKIKNYLDKPRRCCALDSGTTTEQVAHALSGVRGAVPDPFTNLRKLTLVSNSLEIVSVLKSPDIFVEVVLVGGRLQKETGALTGSLSEKCLDNWGLSIDIAICGTTSLLSYDRTWLPRNGENITSSDSSEYVIKGFQCDSQEEADTKAALLDLNRSQLRAVVMDGTKFNKNRSSVFTFAALSSQNFGSPSIDLVITDEGPNRDDYKKENRDEREYEKAREDYQEGIEGLWKSGVAVLVAKEPPSKFEPVQ